MTDINYTNDLKVEVQVPTAGLQNLIKNPDGEQGAWGWESPVANTTMSGSVSPALVFSTSVSQAAYFRSEFLPVAATRYVVARFRLFTISAGHNLKVRFEWYNSSKVLITTSSQTAAFSNSGQDYFVAATQAPANTAYAKIRFDFYNGTGNPSAGAYAHLNNVMVATSVTSTGFGSVRRNVFPDPASTNAATWEAASHNTGLLHVAGPAWNGTESFRLHSGINAPSGAWARTGGIEIVAGQTYTASMYFLSPYLPAGVAGRNAFVKIEWLDAAGTKIGESAYGYVKTHISEWRRASVVGTAPSDAAMARLVTTVQPLDADEFTYFDGIMLEEGNIVGSYFDGSTTDTATIDYAWTGTANNSTSTATVASAGFDYQPPYAWVPITGSVVSLDIGREAMNVGTMSVVLKDEALDPASTNKTLTPGKQVRVQARDGSTFKNLFTGKINNAHVDYEKPKIGDVADRVVATNLSKNPSFESNANGWNLLNAQTVSTPTGDAYAGSKYLRTTISNATNYVGYWGGGGDIPVTAGKTYSIGIAARASRAGAYLDLNVEWINTAGTAIIGAAGQPHNIASGWGFYKAENLVAPAGAGFLRMTTYANANWQVGDTFDLDGAMIVEGSTVPTFFDGDTEYKVLAKNLVTNPSFETNASSWGVEPNTSASVTTADAKYGTQSLLVTHSSPGAAVSVTYTTNLVIGKQYTFSCWVKRAAGTQDVHLAMAGGQITAGESHASSPTGWTRLWHTFFATSTTVTTFVYNASTTGGAAEGTGSAFYLDGVSLSETDHVLPFFDGSTVDNAYGYAWEGTPNASASIKYDRHYAGAWTGTPNASTSQLLRTGKKSAVEGTITITAVDAMADLVNQGESRAVATVSELPYILEGKGVPWNCNGITSHITTATIPVTNDNASVADQVVITRDTQRGHAWVDKDGVLQAHTSLSTAASYFFADFVDSGTTNYISNGNFESTGVGPWAAYHGGTLARSTSAAFSGTNGMRFTAPTSTYGIIQSYQLASPWNPVTVAHPGRYLLTYKVRSSLANARVTSYDNNLDTGYYDYTLTTANTWYTVSQPYNVYTRDNNEVWHDIYLYGVGQGNYPAGTTFDFDDFTLTAVPTNGSYSDIDVDWDTDRIMNQVEIKHLTINAEGNPEEVVAGTYEHTTSVATYGPKKATFTIVGTNPNFATYATNILNANATPKIRVNGLRVPIKDAEDLALAVGMDLCQSIYVAFDSKVSNTYRVNTISHSIDADGWFIDLTFDTLSSNALPQYTPAPPVVSEAIYDTGWVNMTLTNGWSNYTGGGWSSGQYRRIGNTVHLRGLILTTGSSTAAYYTLPSDCRPSAYHMSTQMCASGTFRMDVGSDGTCYFPNGTGAGASQWNSIHTSFVVGG